MSDYSTLVRSLRHDSWTRSASLPCEAADAIDALTARVAQLEACLTDTLQQLELGGVTNGH